MKGDDELRQNGESVAALRRELIAAECAEHNASLEADMARNRLRKTRRAYLAAVRTHRRNAMPTRWQRVLWFLTGD